MKGWILGTNLLGNMLEGKDLIREGDGVTRGVQDF